ncbi:6-pyruvoyl tetrahydropterin synthase [Pediococcus ethanolidurans]|uniref:6-carboxytetrahydropterin synthase n=1 Tax=Pediococcus ethanolidurans TaxID=319653 RepID=UPI0021AA13B1|nr:6-carboxytetrahydropterin synthase [Pediococcus ethanolidurans]MCT4398798.1 6-pyruvoyl tetrahydropterin synthase [Pediococcus ethanolidurans]
MKLVHTYKIKSYVNASHAMRWKSGEGQQHIHTWKIVCEIRSKGDHMIVFRDIEQAIKDVLDSFSGKFLNKLPYFKEINPTANCKNKLATPQAKLRGMSEYLLKIGIND